MSLEKKTN